MRPCSWNLAGNDLNLVDLPSAEARTWANFGNSTDLAASTTIGFLQEQILSTIGTLRSPSCVPRTVQRCNAYWHGERMKPRMERCV